MGKLQITPPPMLNKDLHPWFANPGIQRRLLLESELSFEKAVQTAEAIHKADQETEKFHSVPGL